MSDDDIYDRLSKRGVLKKECNLSNKRKNIKKNRTLKKILYRNYSSDEEDYLTETITKKEVKNMKLDEIINKKNNDEYIKSLKSRFKELDDYEYVTIKDLPKIKLGGYIRCLTIDEELKWGGILIKINNLNNKDELEFVLKNTNNKSWKISYYSYYVFYKKQVTRNDMLKKFLLNKIEM
jgi:hypothetical protein